MATVILKLIDRTNSMRAHARAKGLGGSLIKATCKRPWVADITNGKKVFQRGQSDYKSANSDGTAGVIVVFILWPGRIYEVCEPNPPFESVRYKCRIVDGKVKRL
jgi:hypothetical protein